MVCGDACTCSSDGAVGRVETGGAVAEIVVGALRRSAGHHRKRRLGPGQGLNLGLLIHTHHHGGFGQIQLEANNVDDLLNKPRSIGHLDPVRVVRLQPERLPDPPDRLGGH